MLNGVPRILVIRLSAIGDAVRVLPALHALRDLYPNAQIDWAVEEKAAGILEAHPALDRVLVFKRGGGGLHAASEFTAFCGRIRRCHYDIVVDFHGIAKSGLIAAASRAPKRIGFAPPRAQELSHLASNERVALPSERMNRIEENLELVKVLGAKRHTLDVTVQIPEDAEDEVAAFFHERFHGAKQVIIMHAPVERPEKQWPLEYFAALADRLQADGRYEVVLTWGPGQFETAAAVQDLARTKPVMAPETPDLKHLAALLQRADLFVGGDTGPMHIASAVGTPVVALFGGTDPALHAPLRQPSVVLYAGPDRPAKAVDTAEGPKLLRLITPGMAYDACVRLAHGRIA